MRGSGAGGVALRKLQLKIVSSGLQTTRRTQRTENPTYNSLKYFEGWAKNCEFNSENGKNVLRFLFLKQLNLTFMYISLKAYF